MQAIANILPTTLLLGLLLGCTVVPDRLAGGEPEQSHAGVIPHATLSNNAPIEEYLAYAKANSPGLKAADERRRAAHAVAVQAGALPDPRFTYRYFIEEVETRVGPQRQSIGLQQTVPWFGKLDLRAKIALREADAAKARYNDKKLALFHRVRGAYYDLYYLSRAAEIVDENARIMTQLEIVARAKYKGASGSYASVVKAQVELGKLQDRLRSLEEMKKPVTAKLNAALNRPADAHVSIPNALPAYDAVLSREALTSALRGNSPRLKEFDFLIEKNDLAVQLARKKSFPDVTFGLQYIDTEASNANAAMRPSDSGKDPIVASVGVNLPIWRKKNRAAVREAKARGQATLSDRNELENLLIADLEMALYNYHDAGRKLDLYQTGLLPKAEQSLKVVQQAFASGQASFLEVVDAQRVLLEFQLANEEAITKRAKMLSEIEVLTGSEGVGR
jgi:outer membrane protein, heavy metal efflux system